MQRRIKFIYLKSKDNPMATNEAEYLASLFGGLYASLKKLEKWEFLQLKNLENDYHLEKKLDEKKKELLKLKNEFSRERDRIDSLCIGKFRGATFPGKISGSDDWKEEVRRRHSGFYQPLEHMEHDIEHLSNEVQELRKRSIYSFEQMTKDIRQIQNHCSLIRHSISQIKNALRSASFNVIEGIIKDAEEYTQALLSKISWLEQNIKTGDSNLSEIKEDAQCLRILLDYEQQAKHEIEVIKKELVKIKQLTHPESLYNNIYPLGTQSFRLFISTRANKVLKHNPFILKRIQENLHDLITNGFALLRTGREETDAEAQSGHAWRLLKGGVLRANIDAYGRVFYEIHGDRIEIGDVTPSGKHDTHYMDVCQKINRREYHAHANKELNIIPQGQQISL